jgi:hypothetical protein
MPVKTGIQVHLLTSISKTRLDSGFRRNDGNWNNASIPRLDAKGRSVFG